MNRSLFRTCLLITIATCVSAGCRPQPPEPPVTPPTDARTEPAASAPDVTPQQRALAAKDELYKRLSTRLMEAIGSGGPASAIQVCSQEAPRIATAVGEDLDVTIGRTSFKLRNPRNAPPAWAEPLIEQRIDEPHFSPQPDGGVHALLPIKLGAQCLACHGPPEQIAPAVRAKLDELYPEDQATGFQEGDLRGWFWVEVPPAP